MEATFSDLPDEVINVIATKIRYIEDFFRFGAVCKSSRSVVEYLKKTQTHKISFSPCLMLATYDDDDHHKGGIQEFFSLTSKRIFKFRLPQTQGRRCFGTSFGWVVTIDIHLNIQLFDPFTQNQLSLPPQSTFQKQYASELTSKQLRKSFVHKFMAIQTGPDQSSYVVMAIHSKPACLSSARPGDSTWKLVDNTSRQHYKDVILYNNVFYAIATTPVYIQVIDIRNTSHPKAIDFTALPNNVGRYGELHYLVEMSGRLHFVERFTLSFDPDEGSYATDIFTVHEFDFSTRTWSYLDDLGQYAMFLGINTSYAIDAREFPELKPNCIYYTDDHYCQQDCDMGVYHYGDRSREDIYYGDNIWSEFSRPIFIKPCL